MDRWKQYIAAAVILMSIAVVSSSFGDVAERMKYAMLIRSGKDYYREYAMVSVRHGYDLVERMEKIARNQGSSISDLSARARSVLRDIEEMNITRSTISEAEAKWERFENLLVEMSRRIIKDRMRMDLSRIEARMNSSKGLEREVLAEKAEVLKELLDDIDYGDPWVVGEKANRIINDMGGVSIDKFTAYGEGTINVSLSAGVIELKGKGQYWAKGGKIVDMFNEKGYVRVEGINIMLNFTGNGKVVARGRGVAYVMGSGYYSSGNSEGAWPVERPERVEIAGD